MFIPKPIRLLGAATVLATVPLMSVMAQTPPPSDTQPSTPPAATKPETAPLPPIGPAQRPVTTPRPTDKSVTAPAKANPMIGLAVFSSDGTKLGSVHGVVTMPDGKVTAIHIKTGGFLGFGGKLVVISEGKFTRAGENIQLGMTAEEVSKLPEAKEQS